MRYFFRTVVVLVALSSLFAYAVKIEFHEFENKAQEALYLQLIAELRCVKCQNQNLAESNAGLAKDMRDKTYQMVKQGKDRDDVVNYMTARYGDFVLYRPPLKSKTLLLWVGPAVFLLFNLFLLVKIIRKQGNKEPELLTDSQRDSIRSVLDSKSGNEGKY